MTKIPTIKNSVPKSICNKIPAGKSEKDKNRRCAILEDLLFNLNIKGAQNNRLSAYVEITEDGIKETIFHAKQSKESVIAALNLIDVIRSSVIIRTDKPKEGNQLKKFKLVYIMEVNIDSIGRVRLTVGYGAKKGFLYYCITAIKIGNNSHT